MATRLEDVAMGVERPPRREEELPVIVRADPGHPCRRRSDEGHGVHQGEFPSRMVPHFHGPPTSKGGSPTSLPMRRIGPAWASRRLANAGPSLLTAAWR